ncbi:unnamed protein product [Protopolystoma xenopodis]|uniref:Uncharacterized protein n=1 Tax=Protopolystoma xenopodis TaxID=117903 RepID=A0A3S5B386_9PLAT|nr:unnamed protein product [Protopolystoma xenopodis]
MTLFEDDNCLSRFWANSQERRADSPHRFAAGGFLPQALLKARLGANCANSASSGSRLKSITTFIPPPKPPQSVQLRKGCWIATSDSLNRARFIYWRPSTTYRLAKWRVGTWTLSDWGLHSRWSSSKLDYWKL